MTVKVAGVILPASPHDPGKGQHGGERAAGLIVVVHCLERRGMFSEFISITLRGTLTVGLLLVALQLSGLLH